MSKLIIHGGLDASTDRRLRWKIELVVQAQPPHSSCLLWKKTLLVHCLKEAGWEILGWVGLMESRLFGLTQTWEYVSNDAPGKVGRHRGTADSAEEAASRLLMSL